MWNYFEVCTAGINQGLFQGYTYREHPDETRYRFCSGSEID